MARVAISVPPSSLGALRCGYSLCADWYQSWLWRHCCCRALLSPQPPPRLWRIFLQHRKLSSIAPMIWSCGSIRLLELIITGASVGTARPRAARMFAATRPIRQGCGRREMRSERVLTHGNGEVERCAQPSRSEAEAFPGLYHFAVAKTYRPAGAASTRGLFSRGACLQFN